MFRPQLRLGLHGIVIVAALMLSGGPVSAEKDTTSANYVMRGCRGFLTDEGTHTEPFLEGWCAGIVHAALNYLAGDNGNHCPPNGVTVGQSVRVVVRYIDARPARMHEDFKKLALEAMKAAWPCKP
jgi:hypothetical protein